jgi:hypothetical protein
MYRCLDRLAGERGRFAAVINGKAQGADRLSSMWAKSRGVPFEEHEAEWNKHRRSAGFRRNLWMLRNTNPGLAAAFPGHEGTAHMVLHCQKAGLEVVEFAYRGGVLAAAENPRDQ